MSLSHSRLSVFICALALVPSNVRAQAMTSSFDELQKILKPGAFVAVIDDTGAEIRGRVVEVSAASLTLLEAAWDENNGSVTVVTSGTRRRFEDGSVAEVSRIDASGRKEAPLYLMARRSFDALRSVLKPGTRVALTDSTGHETQGKVAEVSPTSLVLVTRKVRDRLGRESETWRTRRESFSESAVAEIRTADGLENGVAIGLGLGVGLGYLLATGVAVGTESLKGAYLTWTSASVAGALIGAQIDASKLRGPVVYASGRNARGVRLVPLLRKDGQGLLVSVPF